ncbi:hypothetical protein N0V84_000062 [Fusarium piperis]|uniref:Uncharacterized protein n=1 Tax=Fusarium piperis TaxID=1435070 RepID=A0A9W8WNK1_9HYPO|nr:hypothetical protein N0V84_000062 [Fusarium piperis]
MSTLGLEDTERYQREEVGVYRRCAGNWALYDLFLSLPGLEVSLHELWNDWLSKQPRDYIFNPSYYDCTLLLYLVEKEPLRWCYNRPNPDKETWSETAHLVRLLVRWEVVYRIIARLDNGPLDHRIRIGFVRDTLAVVTIWAKLALSGPETLGYLGGPGFPSALSN